MRFNAKASARGLSVLSFLSLAVFLASFGNKVQKGPRDKN